MTQDDGGYDIVPDDSKAPKPKPGEPGWVEPVPIIEKADPVKKEEEELPPADPDVEKHKGLAILAYIFFVIPLVAAPHSKYARFHANQGLLVFIVWFACVAAVVIMHFLWAFLDAQLESIKILWALFGCIFYLLPVVMVVTPLVLMVMGIIHAANGEKKPLPLIGQWKLIK